MARGKKAPGKKKNTASTKKAAANTPDTAPVVGIGASAGGLDAFCQLLQILPGDTGLAFVLVSHIGKASSLDELLRRHTSMPVNQVQRRTRIAPNHVYVIAPGKNLSVEGGTLLARRQPAAQGTPTVIDRFLISLAGQRRDQAIGVILSGTGTDGTQGLAAIRAEGGIAFVQDPRTARFPGMPRAALGDAGSDFILSTADIARELDRIGRHPLLRRPSLLDVQTGNKLESLLDLIEARTGNSFRHYKPATILRRVARRMRISSVDTFSEYVDRARHISQEVDELYRDLLIHFTGFFRDPETWEHLAEEIVPRLLARRTSDTPLRVWVPACASGEEVYSIAMLLAEHGDREPAGPPVRIIGTDVNEASVRKARRGIYPASIATSVSPRRLDRFFTGKDDWYSVSGLLRSMCTFSVHNLIQDPPLRTMDLISCRNVLIYLEAYVQEGVLSTFHRALNPGGVLVLGTTEGTTTTDLFDPLDRKHRVYSRSNRTAGSPIEIAPRRRKGRVAAFRETAPAVVVDENGDILYFRGDVGSFLQPPPGPATLNLFRMVPRPLVNDLERAFREAKARMRPVRRNRIRTLDGKPTAVDVEITPIPNASDAAGQFLVAVNQSDQPAKAVATRTHAEATMASRRGK